MGNHQSSKEWNLIGRESEVGKGINCLRSGRYNCLQITGLKKIGKSRILCEVYKLIKSEVKNCLWKDFQYNSKITPSECSRLVSNAFGSLTNEKEAFVEAFPEGTLGCKECEHCIQSSSEKKLQCPNWVVGLKVAVDMLINYLKESEKETILFLDNVDKLMDANPDIKTCFLHFLRGCLSESFKVVISSTKRVNLVSGNVASMEIEPLKNEDIVKLLYITTDGLSSDSDETIQDIDELFCDKNEVFTPENKPCLMHIARLCDGLPLAAIMSGSLLMEYDNMFSPVELLEILTQLRMKTLSPDNCPPEDRLEIYKLEMEAINELDDQFTAFFSNLADQQQSCEFSIQDALSASEDKSITRAGMKNDVLKKLLDRCVISVRKMSREHQWRWHGVLREANAALYAFNDVSTEPGATDAVVKFTKDNARLIGLELDDEILSDPKEFELAIRRLAKLSTEDDVSETGCAIETVKGTMVGSELLASSSQNNLSIDDNDPLVNILGNINNRTDNENMNIRIPIEHCMQNDQINSLVTSADENYMRNIKLDNIGDISGEKIVNHDVGNISRQELVCQEPHQNTPKTYKTMSYPPCMSAIQRDQANKLGEYNDLLQRDHTQVHDTMLTDKIRASEDQPPPCSSIPNYNQFVKDNKRQNTGGSITHTQPTNVEQISTNKTPMHRCCEMISFNKVHSSDFSKLPLNLGQECCDNRQNNRGPSCLDRKWNVSVGCPNRVDNAQNHPKSEYSNSNHHGNNRLDVCTDGTCHLGTCPTHGTSLSEHGNCSFTGPPGLSYNPPSNSQHNKVDKYRHLCVSSIDPSVGKCSQCGLMRNERQSANETEHDDNSELPVTTGYTSQYESEYGPSAIPCNINNSYRGGTQQQTLPNFNMSQNSSTDTVRSVDENHVMNNLDL